MMTATADTKWNARRRRAIQSVFQTDVSQPTPYSTPSLHFPEKGQPFGGPLSQTPQKVAESLFSLASPEGNKHAAQQTRFDRSWHVVTSRIALPPSVSAEDSFGALPGSQDVDDVAFRDALRDVLEASVRLPLAAHTEDILAWHTQQVRLHFVSHVLPLLAVCDGYADQTQVLLGSIRTLEAAHRQYVFGLSLILRAMKEEDAERALMIFRRDLHAIVGNSMSGGLVDALKSVLGHLMRTVLDVDAEGRPSKGERKAASPEEIEKARKELHELVDSLFKVGFAGERFQILFAELLDSIMITYIRQTYAGVWEPNKDMMAGARSSRLRIQPHCVRELTDWIENKYARLAVEVVSRLGSHVEVSWTDLGKWKEIAVGRLAALRIDELFDIVINWPESEGGVDDLRYAVTTPQRRLQLTDAFSATLQRRLLHAGRSTLDILRTYISMIRTFHKLDHSRVLLDRVAYSLQLYLCTREDTVRIIVTGLLANREEVNSEARKTKLVELVELLQQDSDYRSERQDEEWDDLEWIPAPVDAGSNYKRRKSEDVIGTLISALGSPEVFIKEFQHIMSERLLSEQTGFQQEVGVLDLLKKRFGESSLQACDVMIRDIQDSIRLDGVIHRGAVNHPEKLKQDWTIHARILSRLYWPEVGEERFNLPSSVTEMQKMYERIFELVKPSRKIKWLNHMGQATVELELEDRTISEKVRTYEATVINAFSEENASSWAFDDLWMKLEMDEDLLTAALEFWVKKHVLRRLPDNTYVVIERLSDADQSSSAQAAQSSNVAVVDTHPATPRKVKPGMSEKEKEKRQVYWQFIVGMLTNSSPTMPLGQISMMMKMLIADGFPWSNEELQEFLGEKIADGELEIVGGKYKLVKK
ncbi:Rab GDP dissociation inhibitor alpha [Hypoxylon texense]